MSDHKEYFREEQIQNAVFDKDSKAWRVLLAEIGPHAAVFFKEWNNIVEKLDEVQKSLFGLLKDSHAIIDGKGTSQKSFVSRYGALKVNNQAIPDLDDPTIAIPVSGFFADENGNIDARANASLANPEDFFIEADPENDIYISSISIKISDQNAILSDFGALTGGITNGVQLIYKNQEVGEVILADNLRSNFDIIRLCHGTPAVSSGVEAFRATNVEGNSEGYIPVLSFSNNFGLAYGVRLRAGTFDRLIMRIRDNISGIDAFDVFYYGQKVFER